MKSKNRATRILALSRSSYFVQSASDSAPLEVTMSFDRQNSPICDVSDQTSLGEKIEKRKSNLQKYVGILLFLSVFRSLNDVNMVHNVSIPVMTLKINKN